MLQGLSRNTIKLLTDFSMGLVLSSVTYGFVTSRNDGASIVNKGLTKDYLATILALYGSIELSVNQTVFGFGFRSELVETLNTLSILRVIPDRLESIRILKDKNELRTLCCIKE